MDSIGRMVLVIMGGTLALGVSEDNASYSLRLALFSG